MVSAVRTERRVEPQRGDVAVRASSGGQDVGVGGRGGEGREHDVGVELAERVREVVLVVTWPRVVLVRSFARDYRISLSE